MLPRLLGGSSSSSGGSRRVLLSAALLRPHTVSRVWRPAVDMPRVVYVSTLPSAPVSSASAGHSPSSPPPPPPPLSHSSSSSRQVEEPLYAAAPTTKDARPTEPLPVSASSPSPSPSPTSPSPSVLTPPPTHVARPVELDRLFMTKEERWQMLRLRTSEFVRTAPARLTSLGKRMAVGTWAGLKEMVRNPRVVADWSRSAYATTREAVHHYWIGSKLLVADIRIASRLLKQVARGKSLTRRERNQLLGTAADVFRLVPMAVFVIVPFLEFTLPIFLKLFPNLLPSTFEDKLKKEEALKRSLKAKLEMAKFLQDTVEEMAHSVKGVRQADAVALAAFIERVRNGQAVSNEDLLYFSPLFKDEITLDNLARPQLVAMARFLGLNSYGADALLRFRLRNRLRQINNDDKLILWEGVESLSSEELQTACIERGINTKGVPRKVLQQQLKEWLELSMRKNVPSTLLLMSRAFVFTSSTYRALQETIGSLPDEVVESVLVSDTQPIQQKERRLEALQRQEELIAEEEEERARKAAAAAAEAASSTSALPSMAGAATGTTTTGTTTAATTAAAAATTSPATSAAAAAAASASAATTPTPAAATAGLSASLAHSAAAAAAASASTPTPPATPAMSATPSAAGSVPPPPAPSSSDAAAEEVPDSKIREISEAVRVLAAASSCMNERSELEELKAERAELLAHLLGTRVEGHARTTDPTLRKMGALDSKLSAMISKLDKEIKNVDEKIGSGLNLVDKDRDGIVTVHELQTVLALLRDRPSDDKVVAYIVSRLDPDGDGKVNLAELEAAMDRLEQMDADLQLVAREEELHQEMLHQQQQLEQEHEQRELQQKQLEQELVASATTTTTTAAAASNGAAASPKKKAPRKKSDKSSA